MNSLATENALLERLLTCRHVGISLIDESGLQVNIFSDDPELRSVLVEHQTQRIRELENGLYAQQAPLVPYPVRESAANDYYTADGSGESTPGGQAGDDAAFADALSDLARRAPTPFNHAPTILGS